MPDVVLGMSLQRSYFHSTGSVYLGEKADVLRVRIESYFKSTSRENVIFFTREIHQSNDTFFKKRRTHSVVGSDDIDFMECFKVFPKFVVNVNRYNAFYGTPLEAELSKIRPRRVYLVGVETPTNILYTAGALRERGYEVTIYEPLVTAEDDYMHTAAINMLSSMLSVDVE